MNQSVKLGRCKEIKPRSKKRSKYHLGNQVGGSDQARQMSTREPQCRKVVPRQVPKKSSKKVPNKVPKAVLKVSTSGKNEAASPNNPQSHSEPSLAMEHPTLSVGLTKTYSYHTANRKRKRCSYNYLTKQQRCRGASSIVWVTFRIYFYQKSSNCFLVHRLNVEPCVSKEKPCAQRVGACTQ